MRKSTVDAIGSRERIANLSYGQREELAHCLYELARENSGVRDSVAKVAGAMFTTEDDVKSLLRLSYTDKPETLQ